MSITIYQLQGSSFFLFNIKVVRIDFKNSFSFSQSDFSQDGSENLSRGQVVIKGTLVYWTSVLGYSRR